MGAGTRLTIEDLAHAAGVPVRTVRYYISQGLLPGPGARGRAAAYDDEHFARLRLIRRLADQHVPLAEQRARLAGLSASEVRTLLRDEERRGAALEQASQAPSPRAYVSSLLSRARLARRPELADDQAYAPLERTQPESWRRWELVPGIELHVRGDAAQLHARLIQQLLELSRSTPGRRSEQDAAFQTRGFQDTSHDA
jgi:DNA-binding transcriptional MerR regulator